MSHKILFFGNRNCPFCVKVLHRLEEVGKDFEYNEVPMERSVRSKMMYTGRLTDLNGKSFGEIFGHISIPKMICPDGKKLMSSDEMMDYLST